MGRGWSCCCYCHCCCRCTCRCPGRCRGATVRAVGRDGRAPVAGGSVLLAVIGLAGRRAADARRDVGVEDGHLAADAAAGPPVAAAAASAGVFAVAVVAGGIVAVVAVVISCVAVAAPSGDGDGLAAEEVFSVSSFDLPGLGGGHIGQGREGRRGRVPARRIAVRRRRQFRAGSQLAAAAGLGGHLLLGGDLELSLLVGHGN